MAERTRFYGRTPRSVLLAPGFWLRNPHLILAFATSLLVGLVLPRTLGAEQDALLAVPALAVFSLVFWGLALGARAVARLEVERGISETVNLRAVEWLRSIASGETSRPDLERLEPELLPNNPAPEIGIVRLFQHILKEARDRKSSPGFLIMQPYREESYGDLFRLQSIQRAALQLGILGTFVGLVMAIARVAPGAGMGFEIGAIGPLVGSLDVAFTTSIAGIAVSVILGFLMMVIRGRQDAYFRSMEEATVSVASLARNAINKDEYLAELSQVQVAIHELGDRILDQSQQTEAQSGVLRAGVRKLIETKGELDGFLDRLGEDRNAFLEEMQEIYERLSPERFAERLDERIEASMERMLARLDQGIEASVGSVGELGSSVRAVVEALERAAAGFTAGDERFQEATKLSSKALREVSTGLDRLAQRHLEWASKLDQAVPPDLGEVLKEAVARGFETSTAAVALPSARSPGRERGRAVEPGAGEIIDAVKAVGEVEYTLLRRIVSELSSLRESLGLVRKPTSQTGSLRGRIAVWWRLEWDRTVADFRGLGRALGRGLGWARGGKASAPRREEA